MAYISSLDRKRDYNNTIAYAKKEAFVNGERKKALESAVVMIKDGLPLDQIMRYTKLTAEEIENLQVENL